MARMKSKDRRRKIRAILKRDGPFCHYCCRPLPEDVATLDHVSPRSRGGHDGLTNLVVSCRWCNEKKGTKSAGEFKARVRSRLAAGYNIGPIDWKASQIRKARRRLKREGKP